MNPWAQEVDAALSSAGALPAGARCVVAVSGGRDSMLLLELLAALRSPRRWTLVVAHGHHGLRGADADADARFVRASARRLGLRCVVGWGTVRQVRRKGESLEEAARRWRHAFLAGVARRTRCAWIATGHHAGDQVEGFLLRLLRGAGGTGLGGMTANDPSPADPELRLARPLLGFDEAWLAAAARDLGVVGRADVSNRDPAFLRNRVRHELLPFLRERFQPGADRVLLRVQTLIRDQAEFMAELARNWLAVAPRYRPGFDELPVTLQREALRLQLHRAGVSAGFELIEALRAVPETLVQVDARRRVARSAEGLVEVTGPRRGESPFRWESMEVDLTAGRGRVRFGGWVLEWRVTNALAAPRDGEECFDADAVGGAVRLRHWRPGDRFRPIGLGASAKLQDLFVNAKVPAAERRGRVLAETADGEIFWVEGLRIGERARRREDTRRYLVWRGRRAGRSQRA